jgi:hypothetical protein
MIARVARALAPPKVCVILLPAQGAVAAATPPLRPPLGIDIGR